MDWPCTLAFVRAIAYHFDIAPFFFWREGGFARELARADGPTAPILFETPSGSGRAWGNGLPARAGCSRRPCPTFAWADQPGAENRRPLAAAIRNQSHFQDCRTLVITGELAGESPSHALRRVRAAPHVHPHPRARTPRQDQSPTGPARRRGRRPRLRAEVAHAASLGQACPRQSPAWGARVLVRHD